MPYIPPNGALHSSNASAFASGAIMTSQSVAGGGGAVMPPLPAPHLSISPAQPSYMQAINGGFQAVKIKEEVPDDLDSG